jgi:hypothetical protein
MFTVARSIVVLVVIAASASCKPSTPSAGGAKPTPAPAPTFPIEEKPYGGPPIDLRMQYIDDAKRIQVDITAQAPTGGWALTLDGQMRYFSTLQLFVTLTPPAPDAMVTQAMTELQAVHREIYMPTERVEIYARVAGESEAYRLARRKPEI